MQTEMVGTAIARTEPSDPIEDLIRACAYRDAAGLCAREHGTSLGRLCMALLGVQAEAEEACQDTLIAAHDAMRTFRGEGSVRAWLFGIARRVCAKRLETRTRRDRKLRLVHDAAVEAGLPDELVAARRSAEKVRAALEELRPSERETLLLRYEAGLSHREVGIACGLDEATARKRASRALSRLGEILGEGAER